MKPIFLVMALVFACMSAVAAEEPEFPGREVFVNVDPIELKELAAIYDQALIIDARSAFEYDTLHIKGAKHLSFDDDAFAQKLRKLRESHPDQPVIFYCNGRTCFKSYKAAERARAAGVENVRAFDAGVFAWVRAHPDKSVLLGKSPVEADALISSEQLAGRMLSPREFAAEVSQGNPLVLDIRGRRQRDGVGLFMFKERNISMDERQRLTKFLAEAKVSNRPLLVYDMAGKQVRWLQYYLEDMGLQNYAFMQGGVKAFFDEVIR